ncbi:MAG: hypothetical protein ABIW79_00910 [Gemmatimonas sp.]
MKVSYYYNYDFVSPDPLYAEVKEELKSYFQTGVVDDLMFPVYTERLLQHLGRSSYKIQENIFNLEDFTSPLPEGFEAVRELYLVSSYDLSYRMPSARYDQSTIRVTPVKDRCDGKDVCAPNEINVTYKTTGKLIQNFNVVYLLKPGNINATGNCSLDSLNFNSNVSDTFDIRDNKIVTNFRDGILYMVYYIKDYDDNQYQLIPDNPKIKEYILANLKYKCFETIFNNVSDETFNQLQSKLQYYDNKMLEAKVNAEVEIKKKTVNQMIMSIKSTKNRFNRFNIT